MNAIEGTIKERAGEFVELLCGLEWIAEQLLSNEQEGPGAAVKSITNRLFVFNEAMELVQGAGEKSATAEGVFSELNAWLRK